LAGAIPSGSAIDATYGGGSVTVRITTPIGTTLSAGAVDLVKLVATIPDTAPYRDKQILDLTELSLNNGAVAVRDDDGLQVVAYFGDTSGNKIITTNDSQLVANVVVRRDSGFAAYGTVDPVLLADVNGSGALDSLDSSRILQEAAWYTTGKVSYNRAEIPDLPSGVTASEPVGPDPFVSIPTNLTARQGDLVAVPITVTPADGLTSAQIHLAYDPTVLRLEEVRRGDLTTDFNLFIYGANDGLLKIDLSGTTSVTSGSGGIALALFRVTGVPTAGTTTLDLQWVNLNDGHLVLTPAPVPGVDPTDGRIALSDTTQTADNWFGWGVTPETVTGGVGSLLVSPATDPVASKRAAKPEGAPGLVQWHIPPLPPGRHLTGPEKKPAAAPSWLTGFVTNLATAEDNPNARIKVAVPPAESGRATLAMGRLSEKLIDTLMPI